MCVHTYVTALHKKGYTAVHEKKHDRVHRENGDTAVRTLCTLVEFCTAAHSVMYTDLCAYREGIPNPYYLRTRHKRLRLFQPEKTGSCQDGATKNFHICGVDILFL